uniref:40S ribosomal protein S8 n=1 Tax=Zea mays TaxID=4577 RepID=A0A804N0N0_MAIZE
MDGAFVNRKKLVSRDAVLFLRGDNGELRLGVRRAAQLKNGSAFLALYNQCSNLGSLPNVAHVVATKSVFHIYYNPSNKTVRRVCVRGGNVKWSALRLDTGNYSWGSEALTHKTHILDVVYNASNNELVRTQTLVKSAIVQVDAAPFKQWYLTRYGMDIGRKKKVHVAKKDATEGQAGEAIVEETKKSNHVQRKIEKRQQDCALDTHIEEQFGSGRLLACISACPGQCGQADGYILEANYRSISFYWPATSLRVKSSSST